MEKIACSIEEKGEGKPLLFLHGYLSNKESFYHQTEFFSKTRKTIAVDLPGFGNTSEPSIAYSLSDYVQFVKSIIDEFAGGRVDVIAHSFGGRIALKLASENPDYIDKMLLTGCAGMKPRRSAKYYIKKGVYKVVKNLFPSKKEELRQRFSSSDYLSLSPLMRESFIKIVNEHLEFTLKKITCPTLLVFGEEDEQTPLYMARRIERGIADCALVKIEGHGHFCFCSAPQIFNSIAWEFFN